MKFIFSVWIQLTSQVSCSLELKLNAFNVDIRLVKNAVNLLALDMHLSNR